MLSRVEIAPNSAIEQEAWGSTGLYWWQLWSISLEAPLFFVQESWGACKYLDASQSGGEIDPDHLDAC